MLKIVNFLIIGGPNKSYAFSYTAIGKSGLSGPAIAQFIGFGFQVSGFGCQGTEVLSPET